MKKSRWFLLLLAFCLIPSLASLAEDETPDDLIVTKEQAAAEKISKKSSPIIEIHGDYRYLYGEGRFDGKMGTYPFRQKIIMPTRRARIFITGHLNDMWVIKSELEDNRNDYDHKGDHHAYMGRLYLEGENKAATKYMLGRFNYFVFDGNTLDTRMDAGRIRVGHDDTITASVTYGRLVRSNDEKEKYGFIATLTHQEGKLLNRLGYFNFRNRKDAIGNDLDRQEIWSWNTRYTWNKTFSTTLELLRATGKNDHDHYNDTDYGYVWSLNFRPEVNPAKPGDIDAWIKYYRQPRASIITHTMDGDPLFFGRMGFTGWGARVDYVVTRGLVLAVEGFLLHNYRDDTAPSRRRLSDMTEKVLGTSLTLYF